MTTAGQQIALQANSNVNQNVFGSIIFNVKAYGAKGDGLADDTAAIQAAINAAGLTTSGGVIFFPPGTYKVTSTLIIKFNNIRLRGVGKVNGSRLVTYSDIPIVQFGYYLFSVDGAFTNQWCYEIEAYHLDFSNFVANPTKQLIDVRATQFVRVENCSFSKGYNGIQIGTASDHGFYYNNIFYGVTNVGIYDVGANGKGSTGNVYDKNSFLGGSIGIALAGTFGDLVISNNIFIGPTYGIRAVPSDFAGSTYSNKIGIYNNDFDGFSTYHIYMESCSHVIINNNNFAPDPNNGTCVCVRFGTNYDICDNNFTAGLKAVWLTGGSNMRVCDNGSMNINGNAVVMDTNVINVTFAHNRFASYNDCVTIATGSTGNLFEGNTFTSTVGKDISTYANDYSNKILNAKGDAYNIVAVATLAGMFSLVKQINNITSNTVYTTVATIQIPNYSGAKIELMFSMLLSGPGAAEFRSIEFIASRISAGSVALKMITDFTDGYTPSFDINYDVATTGTLNIQIRRGSTDNTGTALNGTLSIRANGVLAALMS